jgi:23S rRNA (cytosine1962-C5)-methyltransferase
LAVQVLTSGIENVMPVIIDELQKLLNPESILIKAMLITRARRPGEHPITYWPAANRPSLLMVKENNISLRH